jgi:hypothetical protein
MLHFCDSKLVEWLFGNLDIWAGWAKSLGQKEKLIFFRRGFYLRFVILPIGYLLSWSPLISFTAFSRQLFKWVNCGPENVRNVKVQTVRVSPGSRYAWLLLDHYEFIKGRLRFRGLLLLPADIKPPFIWCRLLLILEKGAGVEKFFQGASIWRNLGFHRILNWRDLASSSGERGETFVILHLLSFIEPILCYGLVPLYSLLSNRPWFSLLSNRPWVYVRCLDPATWRRNVLVLVDSQTLHWF